MPGFSTRGYPARPLRRFVRSPGHQSRVVPRCRRARALSCSRRRHTVVLSCGVACSAHGEQRGGSVRRLRTRSGDELARSPAMPRPPPSMMPSIRRPAVDHLAAVQPSAVSAPQDVPRTSKEHRTRERDQVLTSDLDSQPGPLGAGLMVQVALSRSAARARSVFLRVATRPVHNNAQTP